MSALTTVETETLDAVRRELRDEPIESGRVVRYADLRGEGIPDAVITLERHVVGGSVGDTMIEEVVTVAMGIGVKGRPAEERRYERLLRLPNGPRRGP